MGDVLENDDHESAFNLVLDLWEQNGFASSSWYIGDLWWDAAVAAQRRPDYDALRLAELTIHYADVARAELPDDISDVLPPMDGTGPDKPHPVDDWCSLFRLVLQLLSRLEDPARSIYAVWIYDQVMSLPQLMRGTETETRERLLHEHRLGDISSIAADHDAVVHWLHPNSGATSPAGSAEGAAGAADEEASPPAAAFKGGGASAPTTGPASAPAGWHPDPGGRHQHRYWDGHTWTSHVADNGVTGHDPLAY